ncbi:ABC transporter ATP-binding protein [Salinactinospora qingdaonensis]|uniref:ABC transporter ATP-binding protein n=1 Tax=Salinactinospora qingdaonensis TaxID=702744 RepID=A0ABP7F5C6_9ACTN
MSQEAERGATLLNVEELSVEVLTSTGWTGVTDTVSFQLRRGEVMGLVGESGCGKSTTALALMGLLPKASARVASGTVWLDGTDLYSLSRRQWEDLRGDDISMIFQEPMSSLHPAFTVGEQIAESVRRHRDLGRRDAWQRAVALLEKVGMPEARARATCYPHEFSGGMLQRVLIAIALACEPKVLVADEPTTALDVTVQAQILDLLRSMGAEFDLSILLVTHDLDVVADICDEVVVMYAGQVVEQATVKEFLHAPRHPYSRALLAGSRPDGDDSTELHWIPGAPPTPGALPPGCRFEPRCAHAHDRCRAEEIALQRHPDGSAHRCVLDLSAPRGE